MNQPPSFQVAVQILRCASRRQLDGRLDKTVPWSHKVDYVARIPTIKMITMNLCMKIKTIEIQEFWQKYSAVIQYVREVT